MTSLILLTLTLVIAVAVIAYNLALYAMPLMIGVTAFQVVHGAGAGIVLSLSAASVIVVLAVAVVLAVLGLARHPLIRLGGVAIFAGPAVVAGFGLTHGALKHAVESGITVNLLSAVGGAAIGIAAVANVLSQAATPR